MKVFFYTGFALVCFALNSLLCRLALGAEAIDAASFTAIRLVSGALALALLDRFFGEKNIKPAKENWISSLFLFGYAVFFSFAYLNLATATGALILFGTVQATMLIAALRSGERPGFIESIGWVAAFAGLVYLVFPGITAPSLSGSILMAAAGVAWGIYTLRGRGAGNPLANTARNFVCSVVPALFLLGFAFYQIHISARGLILAMLSGAITSGVGYAVWYAALKFHTATRAAILQLSVPVLTAIGGVILLSEEISLRLFLASVLILGGIAFAVIGRKS
ncbi:MAG TPA: DMT family transporter [Pyrinomonadaceae bacterium]|nr:DMT family transporter [Pyrinomonadaceae bacterium]